jgi:cytochrome c-type biogenesis protein CcmH
MSRKLLLWAVLLAAVWWGGTAVLAQAQSGETEAPIVRQVSDDEVNDVSKHLYCPVCENVPLDVCGTQACADWRELVRTKLAQGQSRQEIYDYFARQYGDAVLAEPPRRGINLILWLFPVVGVGLGLVFFGRYLHGLRSGPPPEQTAVAPIKPAPSDDYAARIEQELRGK